MKQLALIVSAIIACSCIGCGNNKPDPRAASFGAALMQCVVEAKTKAESQACRAEVEAKYCDAGECK